MRQRYFILLSAFAFLLGSIFIVLLNNFLVDKSAELKANEQKIYALQAAEGIQSFFDDKKNSLRFLASRDEIIDFGEKGEKTLREFYTTHSGEIKAVTRLSKTGEIVYTYPYVKSAIGQDVSEQPHNREVIETGKPVISDVFKVVQGYRALAYAYPLFKDGEFNGTISLLIPSDQTSSRFLSTVTGRSEYDAFIMSKDGVFLYSSIPSLIGKKYTQNVKETEPNLYDLMIIGKPGKLIHPDTSGNDVSKRLSVFFPVKIESTFWSIAVQSDYDAVSGFGWKYKFMFIAIAVMTLGLVVLFNVLHFTTKNNYINHIKDVEQKYRLVSENTGNVLYEYKFFSDKIILEGNTEPILGFTKTEIEAGGTSFFLERMHPDDLSDYRSILKKAFDTDRVFAIEFRYKVKNGTYKFLENSGTIVGQGNNRTILGAVKDITHRKQAQDELRAHKEELEKLVKLRTRKLLELNETLKEDIERRELLEAELLLAKDAAEKSERLKSEFLAQVSHEIRTPINSILNFVSLIILEAEEYLGNETREGIDIINNAVARLLRTIDLLINMSELETGNYKYEPAEYDIIDEVLKPTLKEFEPIAAAKNLKLEFAKGDERFNFVFDKYTVNQIFTNLIDNAIKYTHKGIVGVKIYKENNYIICKVYDTGIGIKDEFIPFLFSKFSQEEQGYTRRYEGNGLGLALVKEYCNLNNAGVTVESKKGQGSVFTVSFKIN